MYINNYIQLFSYVTTNENALCKKSFSNFYWF